MRSKIFVKIIVILFLALVGGFLYYQYQPTSNTPEIKGENQPQFKKIVAQLALFYTEALVPDRTHTYVEFPFYFNAPHQQAWLSLQTQPNTNPIVILVDHPILASVSTWPHITNGKLTLYQKILNYNSIDDFIKTPPTQGAIIADPVIITMGQLNKIPKAIMLTNWSPETTFDYFLTTHPETEIKDTYQIIRFTIDASNALVTECGPEDPATCKPRLGWKLDLPDNPNDGSQDHNALYLGEIHVDYRQTAVQ